MERRLAAILAADVVDYTRLMDEDHRRTLDALRDLRDTIFEPAIDEHHGRVIKRMGDGWIVDFNTVSDAVGAAQAIQTHLEGHEIITLRIGIHSGEVMFENEDLFGEGVNVAARLEQLAPPGGMFLSDTAHNSLDRITGDQFSEDGIHNLKNVSRPLTVWRWPAADDIAKTPQSKTAEGSEAVKPSLAVLPFTAMGSGEEYSSFADGMTEDLITDLSKISGLMVVARNSSFQFKDQSVDVREVATRLGVKFILEGSLRRAGPVVRINAQLIDGSDGGHIWAERYDGATEDIFSLQDNVCAAVAEALAVQLTGVEKERLAQIPTQNLAAYETYLRARSTPFPPSPDRIAAAHDLFEKVVEMDPEFAGGHAGKAWTTMLAALFGHGDFNVAVSQAIEIAERAIELDDSLALSHSALGMAYLYYRRYDEARRAAEAAIERQPSDADGYAYYSMVLSCTGAYDAALESINRALTLNPEFVYSPYLNIRTQIQFYSGDYQGALDSYQENLDRQGPIGAPVLYWIGGCYEALGMKDKAAQNATICAEKFPMFRLENWNQLRIIQDQSRREEIEALMRASGLN